MKLRDIIWEIKIVNKNSIEDIVALVKGDISNFVELILTKLEENNNPDWNYVREGWIRDVNEIEIKSKVGVLDNGEDDTVFFTTNYNELEIFKRYYLGTNHNDYVIDNITFASTTIYFIFY